MMPPMRLPLALFIASCGVIAIALAMLVGPAYSPDAFSWLRHSTSEQAGQNMMGAWIMRLGFVAYGAGVAAAAGIDWRTRTWMRLALAFFGVGLIATAIWSNAPIVEGLPSNLREDALHSLASGIVGFAFALACAARLFFGPGEFKDIFSWAGLLISVLIPLAMGEFPEIRGLLQRAMFVFSFVYVLREFAKSP
jgi:hypothetical protein